MDSVCDNASVKYCYRTPSLFANNNTHLITGTHCLQRDGKVRILEVIDKSILIDKPSVFSFREECELPKQKCRNTLATIYRLPREVSSDSLKHECNCFEIDFASGRGRSPSHPSEPGHGRSPGWDRGGHPIHNPSYPGDGDSGSVDDTVAIPVLIIFVMIVLVLYFSYVCYRPSSGYSALDTTEPSSVRTTESSNITITVDEKQ